MIIDHCLDDARQSAADAVIGGAFAVDDVIGSVAHPVVDGCAISVSELDLLAPAELVERRAADGQTCDQASTSESPCSPRT